MKGLIEGKVAIITGAGSGVGRAAAQLFAEHGAKIVAADVDMDAAEETVARVRAAGSEAIAVFCNVAERQSVDDMVAAAVSSFGRLDIMYNNVGVSIVPKPGDPLKSLITTDDADINRLQGINVNGVIYGCQAAIRQFQAQGGDPGVIVNTASVSGLIGYGGVIYGATKGAVVNFTRTLALEVAAQGIRVNSVCPAGMPTNFMGKGFAENERVKQSMGAAHPLGHPIDPTDCANAALFLASSMAANITGVNLPVDGGLSAGIPPRWG